MNLIETIAKITNAAVVGIGVAKTIIEITGVCPGS
jgi:hypothetical protein